MAKKPSKVTRGSIRYITNQEHDNGLVVCNAYRDLIDDSEFDAINWLCMAYGNNEGLDTDLYDRAIVAIRRVRTAVK